MKSHRVVERQHPVFSPIALAATAMLILGLSLAVWLTGGLAFSPGDLSARTGTAPHGEFASHAAFEEDCSRCHAPFAGIAAARCEACHASVAGQRLASLGLHGLLENGADCASCHLEHRGRDVDLSAAAVARFDHDRTAFSLVKHTRDFREATIDCLSCHNAVADLRGSPLPCVDCHVAANGAFVDLHVTAFGSRCLDCHDGLDTLASLTAADHAPSFALAGAHEFASCASCHAGGRFEGTPTSCVACHDEPQRHAGQPWLDCAACHRATSWQDATLNPAVFDHGAGTSFSLSLHQADWAGNPLGCAACHTGTDLAFTPGACRDCHGAYETAFISEHVALVGDDCLACHDGVDRMTGFDHAVAFPLTGAHRSVACASCHVNRVFAGTPRACVACHGEPALHAGLFGTECASCHEAGAWRPARLTRHAFPLDHGVQGEIPCATCHTDTFTGYTCDACHEPAAMADEHVEEGISLAELAGCARCHSTGDKRESEDD